MDRATELALLEELQGLKDNGLFFLDETTALSPVARYLDEDRFVREQAMIFRALPQIAALSSEIAEPGDFMTRDFAGLPLLLTRDRDGKAHAFLNVCRHRGAHLVADKRGCKNAFSCPYHAWTYSNSGALRGIPHEKPGFPGIDKSKLGLTSLPMVERFGMIWVVAKPGAAFDFDSYLDPLATDFDWLGTDQFVIAQSSPTTRAANWKLLAEGGLEAYHFKVAHKDTIGPHFLDNLSSYAELGDHLRSVLPRNSLPDLKNTPRADWAIRDHANVLYTVFPTSQFLVMQDHVAWVEMTPKSAGVTELRIATLVPKAENTPDKAEHWARNHKITSVTLDEDFEINEAVQAGLASGANTELTFGRYEGALEAYNRTAERYLDA